MTDEGLTSRIERLKVIYRDFFENFLRLDKEKNQIFDAEEAKRDRRARERIQQKINTTKL